VDSPVSEPEVSEDKKTNLVSVTKAFSHEIAPSKTDPKTGVYIQHPEIFSCIPSGL